MANIIEFLSIVLFLLAAIVNFRHLDASAEQIPLNSILPKLQAIHEDAQTLLIKNSELKSRILAGLQEQNDAKLKLVKESKMVNSFPQPHNQQLHKVLGTMPTHDTKSEESIDYSELDEFNRWVEVNLEYAVKNTRASSDALKEEAQQNSGNVEYSEQAIKDGVEGVKYWQSAIIFQDKTLNNEKYRAPEITI